MQLITQANERIRVDSHRSIVDNPYKQSELLCYSLQQ